MVHISTARSPLEREPGGVFSCLSPWARVMCIDRLQKRASILIYILYTLLYRVFTELNQIQEAPVIVIQHRYFGSAGRIYFDAIAFGYC